MPANRFEPSSIKNKLKREEVARKAKKGKRQEKLQRRLARAKVEANDPLAKKKRLAENVPRTLDNTREFDPSILTAAPSSQPDPPLEQTASDSGQQPADESALDISSDPFASYFASAFDSDPSVAPKVLITTSFKSSKLTYDFCDELVNVVPGAEFIRRKKGKGFEIGNIAAWAAGRGYSNMVVVNEDMKKPNAITLIHLPEGPSSYFRLSSIQLTKQISGHARSTDHFPELVLNNFVTRLGHTVGRMFQTLFPPMPEFQGRQVVTLHNQRDFLFFRRHRYAFRSTEKAALQEIGPRFTLKLRWMKKGIPAVQALGQPLKPLELAPDEGGDTEKLNDASGAEVAVPDNSEETAAHEDEETSETESHTEAKKKIVPPTKDEYIWMWKPELETSRRTFFL
ncbi:Brix-domain-containing protein [Fomitiporia mediterranea MF3/22]|uniref:Brix-domain-containing protein n=1 Tax=Fomitiporia mediterranea (strain MF3/22) TaxID=694068 RepID=UPI00044087F8|nr:Brix-domain-containing protein [Fomitiporia mediterranea MF3/22]EJD08536.1 Brix-domain-containing protein [Fomitiporia mediterranea MF3/22]